MQTGQHNASPAWLLGIEGGATNTRVAVIDLTSQATQQLQLGPANLRLLSNRQLLGRFRAIRARTPWPAAIGIGLAGARTRADRDRIYRAADRIWPGVPCQATHDLEIALAAAPASAPGASSRSRTPAARVLVLSGTGSCCFGQTKDGATAKVGGWGHLLGDRGSGYEIGLRALRTVVQVHDHDPKGVWPLLGRRLLRALHLNEPEELIDWAQGTGKAEIAALAREVFDAAKNKDKLAAGIVKNGADALVQSAIACARRLVPAAGPVEFILAGGLLAGEPRFRGAVARRLQTAWPGARVRPLGTESVWGAVELARKAYATSRAEMPPSSAHAREPTARTRPGKSQPDFPSLERLAHSPTEQRHPRSMNLDRLSLKEAVALMLREDARIPAALLKEQNKIVRGIGLIARAFRRGGRLFYVGAGTSGRLGVLDASECPPTFQTDPDLVQGIMAGGQRALWESVEGAEDDPDAGERAVIFRGVEEQDVVVGIAASGRTPFVWGALQEAARRGAATMLICFNPNLKLPKSIRPTLCIAPRIGPEILTGSTRLKAGTATKLILNMFTTLAMVRLGKVMSNLMIDVNPSNTKLRDRAVRIVQSLANVDAEQSLRALEKANWNVRQTISRLQRGRC